jgi:hypothetical protein
VGRLIYEFVMSEDPTNHRLGPRYSAIQQSSALMLFAFYYRAKIRKLLVLLFCSANKQAIADLLYYPEMEFTKSQFWTAGSWLFTVMDFSHILDFQV